MQKSFAWIVTTDFFSQPPSYLTHSSPGLRQSLEINGIFARAKKHKTETQLKKPLQSNLGFISKQIAQ